MTEFLKNLKNHILGPFWALFAQIWATMNIPGKWALSVFKCSNYLPLFRKSEKTNEAFLTKMPSCWMDR